MDKLNIVFSKLPDFAKPSNYKIFLAPNLNKFTFDGQVSIQLEVLKKTDFFILHSHRLDIQEVILDLSDGTRVPILKDEIQLEPLSTLFTLRLPVSISPQTVTLNIRYTGEINNILHGFSRSTYKALDGSTKFMASTQFESTYARMAFPCWDEPIYKATFDLTLEVSPELTALSNMHAIEERINERGNKFVRFATTPTMSTYLVAFAIGDLEYIEAKAPETGIDVRVYTVPGKKEMTKFALEAATKSLDWYAKWFGVPMPLKKCDLVAIPDFSMGAMENWGLITFREIHLLHDPKKTSRSKELTSVLVVSHEIAHFWFGNLVTMKWWTDLWLKEGFASLMEYLFTAKNYPELKAWMHFLSAETFSGLNLDALRNSHPIEVEIGNPRELEEIYDSITYAKGNCVNRMLLEFLGEDTFKKGLNLYLNKYMFSNAETVDLWACFNEASHNKQDIDALMSAWTKQMGFPLVSASREGNILRLSQSRFLADGSSDDCNTQWKIPISITTSADPTVQQTVLMMDKCDQEFVLDGAKPAEWIKLNFHTNGFFRVRYSGEMLKPLLTAFGTEKLGPLDRYGIVEDICALFKSHRVPASTFLDLLKQMDQENEYMIWVSLDFGLGVISNLITHMDDGGAGGGGRTTTGADRTKTTMMDRYNLFIQKHFVKHAERMGPVPKPGEDKQEGLLRSILYTRLARADYQPAIQTAIQMFTDYVDHGKELVPEMRKFVFGTVARTNKPKYLEVFKKINETANFGEIEVNAIDAMGQFTGPGLLDDVYKYCFHDAKIRLQDLIYLFVGSAQSKISQEYAWNFVKNNFGEMMKRYDGVNSLQFQQVIKECTKNQCSEEVATNIRHFFESALTKSERITIDRLINQCAEAVQINARLLAAIKPQIDKYLAGEGF